MRGVQKTFADHNRKLPDDHLVMMPNGKFFTIKELRDGTAADEAQPTENGQQQQQPHVYPVYGRH